MRARSLFSIMLAFALVACASGGNPHQAGTMPWALAEITEQRYAAALPVIRRLAEEGNPQAQNQLAKYYEAGLGGVAVDYEAAHKWYKAAGEQADYHNATHAKWKADGLLSLVAKQHFDAQRYSAAYELATSNYLRQSPDMMYLAGIMLRDGLGVQRDVPAADRLLRQAAAKGHIGAQKLINATSAAAPTNAVNAAGATPHMAAASSSPGGRSVESPGSDDGANYSEWASALPGAGSIQWTLHYRVAKDRIEGDIYQLRLQLQFDKARYEQLCTTPALVSYEGECAEILLMVKWTDAAGQSREQAYRMPAERARHVVTLQQPLSYRLPQTLASTSTPTMEFVWSETQNMPVVRQAGRADLPLLSSNHGPYMCVTLTRTKRVQGLCQPETTPLPVP